MILFGFFAGWALHAVFGVSPGPVYVPTSGPTPAPLVSSRTSSVSFLDMSDDELLRVVENDPSSLGSLSIGTPASAVIFNSIALPADPLWEILPQAECWATSETIQAIQTVVGKVHEVFPETPPIMIGDISASEGGRLKRHASHQAGRDVDFGFYFKAGKCPWFVPGTSATLDLPRNWALVRAIVTCTDVETIFLDSGIQKLLYGYARSIGEDKDWLDRVFRFPKGSPSAIICYARGHRSHYHVRFYSPVAQELGRRVYPMLIQANKIKPPVFTVPHLVRNGETLGHLAQRYGTSIRAIQQANGLATTQIRAGRSYRIPLRGVAAPSEKPLVVPARLLPPKIPEVLAAAVWPMAPSLDRERFLRLVNAAILGASALRRI